MSIQYYQHPSFSGKARDVQTDCSYPDAANPCKHIAAVYYLLGEAFDQDPFLIFTLRGRNREQIIEGLRQRRAAYVQQTEQDAITITTPPQTYRLDAENFWGDAMFDWSIAPANPPQRNASILQRLGTPPSETQKSLEAVYHGYVNLC